MDKKIQILMQDCTAKNIVISSQHNLKICFIKY